jgi:CRISPR-associated protein Cas1
MHSESLAVQDPAPLPSPGAPPLIPARMLNEFAYCPRLGYLMWVQGEFTANEYTEDGKRVHRRADSGEDPVPDPREPPQGQGSQKARSPDPGPGPETGTLAAQGQKQGPGTGPDSGADPDAPRAARSVLLSSETLGLVARIDILETQGVRATPVDYKRGHKPDIPEGAWEPERVQLAAQGLLLREHGFDCQEGVIYYAASKRRVTVPLDEALAARTLELAGAFRLAAQGPIPPPLDHSRKCPGCSLAGVCLPDETLVCAGETSREGPRGLVPPRDDALPLYVQAQGAYVRKKGDVLVVEQKGQTVAEARLFETSQVVLMGNVQITTQTMQELLMRGIPVIFTSMGGWLYGMANGIFHKNIELRIAQHKTAADPEQALALARRFVAAKIKNTRTFLRRNAAPPDPRALRDLKRRTSQALAAASAEELLGIEGAAAKAYFDQFPAMLRPDGFGGEFSFDGRNRRPPRDPVNAMLSYAYSLLSKECMVALAAAGFDPHLGFYHKPRYGRPSLALDLMEEFRPIVADSVVISAVNNGVVTPGDFVRAGLGVALKPGARRAFILAYERRMDQLIRHPVFGYQISYRRVLHVQARLLGRHLLGEIPEFPEFLTR